MIFAIEIYENERASFFRLSQFQVSRSSRIETHTYELINARRRLHNWPEIPTIKTNFPVAERSPFYPSTEANHRNFAPWKHSNFLGRSSCLETSSPTENLLRAILKKISRPTLRILHASPTSKIQTKKRNFNSCIRCVSLRSRDNGRLKRKNSNVSSSITPRWIFWNVTK